MDEAAFVAAQAMMDEDEEADEVLLLAACTRKHPYKTLTSTAPQQTDMRATTTAPRPETRCKNPIADTSRRWRKLFFLWTLVLVSCLVVAMNFSEESRGTTPILLPLRRNPLLEIIFTTWNDVHMLPYTVRFYRKRFPSGTLLLTVYDNESDDGTKNLAIRLGCRVMTFSTGGTFNDEAHMRIKNEAWKTSRADWIIVADTDEWIDVMPRDLETYEQANVTVIRTEGVELVWPEDTLDLTAPVCAVTDVSKYYWKPALFDRRAITEIRISPGGHIADPRGQVAWLSDVKPAMAAPSLYHAKYFHQQHMVDRAMAYAARMSKENRERGYSIQYFQPNGTKIKQECVQLRKVAKPVPVNLF